MCLIANRNTMGITIKDLGKGDIVYIELPSYDGYKGRAKITMISHTPNIRYPINVKYLDDYVFDSANKKGHEIAISFDEIIDFDNTEQQLLAKKDFSFINI